MKENQLGENLNKIHHSSIKNSQALGKLASESVANLSKAHSSLGNHVAKNMQLAAVNMMTAKSLEEMWVAMKGNGNAPLPQEYLAYQESMRKTFNNYFHQFSEANNELFEDAKIKGNEFFRVISQNAPDGLDALIKPYQTAFNIGFEEMKKIQEMTKSYIGNFDEKND